MGGRGGLCILLAGGGGGLTASSQRVCRICSKGDAVFEVEDATEEVTEVTLAEAGDAVTEFVAPGLKDNSGFNTEDLILLEERGDPKGVLTAVSPEHS